MDLDQLQHDLGIRMNDPLLLLQAVTHRSYINEHPNDEAVDYERLEFLGDAVIGIITARMLFHRFPDLDEGELTRIRSALVRTEALAEIARSIRLGEYLRMGRGEVRNGGRERDTILCRAFEAVVGAVYVDLGMDAAEAVVTPRLSALQHRVLQEALDKDPRSRLQELTQAELDIAPAYKVLKSTGPDHDRTYMVEVALNGHRLATGSGHTIRTASHAAAANALRLFQVGGRSVRDFAEPAD
ncbi:MAG: ribonuclease III [Chloroflexi bacterium]|nr:ribonuclease III [Chloroflexota bacterium]MBV6435669.1 Ribonuclease 3 [Anaerolineae bacterium]MDL1915215.1 ribonuclease III [Anaerolineae bacterium CFX4]OQY83889.1 MAG: ribonuclease III [Anaerolineae bacterium UTCFX5]MCC6567071.1 ribonuclease III [Chloroflexota bacterium]